MQINTKELYLVYWPKHGYQRADIFNNRPNSLVNLRLIFLGGIQPKDIEGIYTSKTEAQRAANVIYEKFNIKR